MVKWNLYSVYLVLSLKNFILSAGPSGISSRYIIFIPSLFQATQRVTRNCRGVAGKLVVSLKTTSTHIKKDAKLWFSYKISISLSVIGVAYEQAVKLGYFEGRCAFYLSIDINAVVVLF